jgi:hypothetical protein
MEEGMKTGRGMSLRLPLRITCEEFNKELFDKGGRQEEEKEEKEKEAKKEEEPEKDNGCSERGKCTKEDNRKQKSTHI